MTEYRVLSAKRYLPFIIGSEQGGCVAVSLKCTLEREGFVL